jgi:Excreted virulence factor EspC, type VII ESX diderm
MTQPDIQLDTAALRSHARMVDETARMCDEAAGAARYVGLHDEVYGMLCSPLVLPLINPLQDWALEELRSGADATSHLAELLHAVADDADVTDATAAQRFRKDR